MKIYLTGSSGFIGTHFCSSFHNFEIEKIDLRNINISNIHNKFNTGILIHCASATPSNSSNDDFIIEQNKKLLSKVCHLITKLNIELIINFSAISMFNGTKHTKINENTEFAPLDYYSKSKVFVEKLLYSDYYISNKIGVINLRLPCVLGLGAKDGIIPRIREALISNHNIEIYNTNSMFNNVVYIFDVFQFINRILQKYNAFIGKYENFNLATSKPEKFLSVLNYMKNRLNSSSTFNHNNNSRNSFVISIDKAERYGFNSCGTIESISKYINLK